VRLIANAPFPSSQLQNNSFITSFLDSMVDLVNGTTWGVKLDGINFDIEDPFGGELAAAYVQLLNKTASTLKSVMGGSFEVSVDVAWSPNCIDQRCYDLSGTAAVVDLLFVMAYDMRSEVFPSTPCLASANSPFPLVTAGMLNFTQLGLNIDPQK